MRPSQPVEGYYRTRLVAGGPWCPVRIWHGPPADPVTGELLDRSWRWQAMFLGEMFEGDVLALWLRCAGQPISRAEHDYLAATHQHAIEHEPDMPEAAPKTRIDHHTMKPIF